MRPARLNAMLGSALPLLRPDPRPDAELLARFLDEGDEAAFEALLLRHTPAVRAACRGWLRSAADVDDAAQATFLVLVQRGRSIRDRHALGRWLYGVAGNVARRLRRQQPPSCPVPDEVPGRERTGDDGLRDLIEEEIARQPVLLRQPVQLCYAVGLTTAEAARRLGWPKGTVLTRLAWARERLRKSLERHGVSPAVLPALAARAAPAVSGAWLRTTTRAAVGLLAGDGPAVVGVSGRTLSLTEGVVRAMFYDRFKYVAVVALLAAGLAGFGLRHWAAASDGTENGPRAQNEADPRGVARLPAHDEPGNPPLRAEVGKPDEGRFGRRREAIIRLPSGTFVKEVDAASYGTGRLTWTYEEDRVQGSIEGSVMGVEFELATEAEISLSSNGTIYGLVTSVRLNHLRVPEGEPFAEIKPFIGLWPAVEPLVNETLMDLPFSYQFRVQGDRLVISNFRALLSGPNPLGKVGGIALGEMGIAVAACQALGTAIEGTYSTSDGKERAAPGKRPLFLKPRGTMPPKTPRGGVSVGTNRTTVVPPARGTKSGPAVPAPAGKPTLTGGLVLPAGGA
jgi:RNA polymerase sigma factor (sigma-70 family)